MRTATSADRDLPALSGLLAAVVFIGGLPLTGMLATGEIPRPDAPTVETARYFLANGDLAALDALVHSTAALLLVVFTGSLAALVRRVEPRPSGLAEVALGAGVLAAAFLTVSALLGGTLGAEQITGSPATVGALRQLSFFLGGAGHTAFLGMLVGAASLAAARANALPRWLTTAGLVSAIASILSLLSLVLAPTLLFIPVGRFSALLVIAAASVLLATGRTGQGRAAGTGASVAGGLGVVVLAFAITVFI
ncbi:MAG: hypothetical protein GEV09_15970 [Pseudonocardiaceae bacterium]|nr:hypothetical protein [Pseudonocardiaceae bacterium]